MDIAKKQLVKCLTISALSKSINILGGVNYLIKFFYFFFLVDAFSNPIITLSGSKTPL